MDDWKCLFCDRGRPDVEMSHEHGVPKWIRRIPSVKKNIRLAKGAKYRDIPITQLDPQTQSIRTEIVQTKTKALHVTQMTLDVCKTCNTGWMALLEEKIKHILTPSIEGQDVKLTRAQATLVALWAAKTAAVAELDVPQMAVIDDAQRRTILEQQIPEGFAVYSARAATPSHMTWVTRPGARHPRQPDGRFGERSGTHVGVAMSAGHLMILVRAIQPESAAAMLERCFPPLGSAWQQIWPLKTRSGPHLFHNAQSVNPIEAKNATGLEDRPVYA
ncbi:hypothetical protein [Clavibacter capsici]|uniref:hypothetical protein n=1 Tax=Clavibacter capsici TaxID=1874630 RepID=UPI00293EA786|nr:hypothetical protein [Clavibacter capsici]